MDRKTFDSMSAQALRHLDETLGDLEHDDLDVDLGGDVLTLSFRDGGKFIINSHSAAGQIWMAAGTTAWHFDPQDDGTWIASKTNEELMATVARVVSERLGQPVSL